MAELTQATAASVEPMCLISLGCGCAVVVS
jgi:hypothetical protein